jgi:hypothetical protein
VTDPDDDYDLVGADDLDRYNDEPVGSCDWCGTHVYADGYGAPDLCDQCAWHAAHRGQRVWHPARGQPPNNDPGGWQPVL